MSDQATLTVLPTLTSDSQDCGHSSSENHVLTLDKYTQSVTIQSQPKKTDIQLTPIQFELLRTLIQHQDKVLTKPFLYQTVLQRPFTEYDRALDMHISRMRKRLIAEGMPPDQIQTIHRKGYLFKSINR
ncbi:winged helix family transcriptional regulator [Vibrio parahaemolyticus]|nr:winged helix-turn-helix domain-containing protein [Vibrio parahaemolyticus]EGQ8294235.1 winged helix family transcriptional regulator [Vibrio parahaemolyticus]EGQ8898268.1 winged helix family transcriptional regulator [Vibrio parahaemolyticus]EGQ9165344.1 winged helix-turn-helix transcriptional regulator [Vibrio parahaemolyticus]EGR2755705.1 winged helix family transcriptional regulator [Vibrio parahaemolyticus]EGR3108988.1 winged helix family transcriptional regulator [Vibrio parahaemolyti